MPDLLDSLRSKYPQYADVPDRVLRVRIAAKYPQYAADLKPPESPPDDAELKAIAAWHQRTAAAQAQQQTAMPPAPPPGVQPATMMQAAVEGAGIGGALGGGLTGAARVAAEMAAGTKAQELAEPAIQRAIPGQGLASQVGRVAAEQVPFLAPGVAAEAVASRIGERAPAVEAPKAAPAEEPAVPETQATFVPPEKIPETQPPAAAPEPETTGLKVGSPIKFGEKGKVEGKVTALDDKSVTIALPSGRTWTLPRETVEAPRVAEEAPPKATKAPNVELGPPESMRELMGDVYKPNQLLQHTPILKNGKPVGELRTAYDPKSKALTVDWLQFHDEAAGGPGAVRDVLRQLKERYPDATKVEYERETGTFQGKPKPKTAEVPASAPTGRSVELFSATPGKKYAARYRLLPLDDLVTNHPDVQPRNRARAASTEQIAKIGKNLDAGEYLAGEQFLDRGAALVGPDLKVESGNGRVGGIRYARENVPDRYRQFQADQQARAQEFGLTAKDFEGVKDPVIVRERTTDVPDRKAFAEEANVSAGLGMSPAETAARDARAISPEVAMGLHVGETQTLEQALASSRNAGIVRDFLKDLPANERATLQTAEGTGLNPIGLQRIKAALLARAFPGEAGQRMVQAFTESTDSNVRNAESGIFGALPSIAKARELIASGVRPPMDISEDVAAAVGKLSQLRQQGMLIEDYLRQQQLGARELTPFQEQLLEFMGKARSPKPIREMLQQYSKAIADLPEPGQSALPGFQGVPPPTKEQLFARATQPVQADLLAPAAEPPFETMPKKMFQQLTKKLTEQRGAAGNIGNQAEDAAMANRIIGGGEPPVPPAPPTEEPPGGPRKAGNINLDRINSTEDVKTALEEVAARNEGFIGARRGVISLEETQKLADSLGMRTKDLLKRRKGTAFNAEQAVAARNLLVQSADDLVGLANKAVGGSEYDLVAFQRALTRHTAIQEQVAGMTAEAGRALSSFRILAEAGKPGEAVSSAQKAEAIKNLLGQSGGRPRIEEMARNIASFTRPEQVNIYARNVRKTGPIFWTYLNALVSNPVTWTVKTGSDVLTNLMSTADRLTAGALGKLHGDDKVYLREASQDLYGMVAGARDSLIAAAETARTGEEPFGGYLDVPPIKGPIGSLIGLPTRILKTITSFFQTMKYRQEVQALALRQGIREGMSKEALDRFVQNAVNNPPPAIHDAAAAAARYVTHTRPLGPTASLASRAIDMHPTLKFIVPFRRIGVNLGKWAMEHSLSAPILKEVRDDIRAGGARRDLAVARMLNGTGIMAWAAAEAAHGNIIGSEPTDPAQLALFRAQGKIPQSFKVGNQYVSFARIEPIASNLGVAADFVQLLGDAKPTDRYTMAGRLAASVAKNLTSKTYLSTLADAVKAMANPSGPEAARMMRREAGSLVPGIVAQAARSTDDFDRETQTAMQTIHSRIPIWRKTLPVLRDALGRPVKEEGTVGPSMLSPLWTRPVDTNGVLQELSRLKMGISAPQKSIGKNPMHPDDYTALTQRAGEFTQRMLSQIMQTTGYRRVPDQEKRDLIRKTETQAKQLARQELLMKSPRARAQWLQSIKPDSMPVQAPTR